MACFTVGLNGPYSWAIAPTARSMCGKWLAQPGLFGWIERRPNFATSIVILMAGSIPFWLALPRVGLPVPASRYDMRVVMHVLVNTNS